MKKRHTPAKTAYELTDEEVVCALVRFIEDREFGGEEVPPGKKSVLGRAVVDAGPCSEPVTTLVVDHEEEKET